MKLGKLVKRKTENTENVCYEACRIRALTFPSAAALMLSASSNESIPLKYLNHAPEHGISISIS
jgi:hypothetical protein